MVPESTNLLKKESASCQYRKTLGKRENHPAAAKSGTLETSLQRKKALENCSAFAITPGKKKLGKG